MQNTPSPTKRDSLIKWGAMTVFLLVLTLAGYTIYMAKHVLSTQVFTPSATVSVVKNTAKPAMADSVILGTPAPAQITSSADLTAVDQSLDSANIDSITSGLSQNDADIASF